MRRLRGKLHSESGASILLVLLLLLLCCMVSASILAAAASNAGKIRSNRVEQQKYLTLSSAIRLIADEIEKAEYKGQYNVYEWTVKTEEEDAAGNVIRTTSEDFYYIEQIPGDYSCGVRRSGPDGDGELTALIPLGKELDGIFRKQFVENGYKPLENSDIEDTVPRTLSVTVPDGLDGYPYPDPDPDLMNVYKAQDVVTVRVELNHDTRHIVLTAWLGEGGAPVDMSDTMVAELVAENPPVIDYIPLGRKKDAAAPPEGASQTSTVEETGKRTTTTQPAPTVRVAVLDEPMTWKLYWIKKGVS